MGEEETKTYEVTLIVTVSAYDEEEAVSMAGEAARDGFDVLSVDEV